MDNMKADTNCYMDKNWPSHLIAHNYGIEDLNKLINIINQERLDIHQKLADRQFYRDYERSRLGWLANRKSNLTRDLLWQRRKLLPLQKALTKLSFAKDERHQMAIRSCSVEKEMSLQQLTKNAKNVHFHLLHGTNTLAEENKLLKEANNGTQQREAIALRSSAVELLKELIWELFINSWWFPTTDRIWIRKLQEGIETLKCTGDEAIDNAAMKAVIWNIFGSKKEIQGRINAIENQSEELRKEYLAVRHEIKRSSRNLEKMEKDVISLENQWKSINQRKSDVLTNACIC
ncbi:uncharacterized protein LOC110607165 isoform X2 [Manihot esculenta]|uniref:Uncharacterized protein n=2 Tax=Manihot esculenta TaxID=3983 RepID=A0ACB7G2G4_MANES|nr:uncharacterized protein LOC110607165 isoform X2 [Manihot esculenta]KAG8633908.1 hypothetical protein MANES_18G145698v8 [Manihot esculenta]KAG8633909.1 hypothetical protein MANES_18G145698v8 [Manihot esculenta]